ncbi:MAG: hypothetical protein ACJ8J0_28670 [Longimicrobiaceae bacterium]
MTYGRTSIAALVGALAFAAPLAAQGPVLPRQEFSRLAAPAVAHPAPLIAGPTELSKPHLYYSVPLSAFFGLGGMLVGYGVGLSALGCEDESPGCGSGPDNSEYATAYLGLALGAATGAHWGGRRHDSIGSFWATLGGAALGALPLLIAPKDDDQTGAWVGSIAGGTAGAVLVDYLVRRPR